MRRFHSILRQICWNLINFQNKTSKHHAQRILFEKIIFLTINQWITDSNSH